jgi:hypothetical protein
MDDPLKFGELTNEFSLILTSHCGNKTIHIFAQLIQDIVARQHVEITVKTYSLQGVDRMRELNIRAREKLVQLIRDGNASEAEVFWKNHLKRSAEVVFSAYRAQMPIDVLQVPTAKGVTVPAETQGKVPAERQGKRKQAPGAISRGDGHHQGAIPRRRQGRAQSV